MIKAILFALGFYFVFSLLKVSLFKKKSSFKNKKDTVYKNLDIKDADFEDIDGD